ncbi:hypothetical protein Pcinc_006240 [Petrolisthes cinctipes]|uniref:Regulatory protein zeste n=1 Tax=Petrolisthes cinctipes TaxID=88211 RepID=A0AAE1KYG3_PETCI|nr:hypothetical protein Pcinc_006240 [Petrolisthes cinctipes]
MASYVYSAPTKKRKQATFTEDELEVMVTEVTERKQVIFPAFSETITRRLKDTAWREVTAAVNRVSRAGRRSEQDVSKKFRDYRSSLKNKIPKHRSEVKKTAFLLLLLLHVNPDSGTELQELGMGAKEFDNKIKLTIYYKSPKTSNLVFRNRPSPAKNSTSDYHVMYTRDT